MFGGRLSVTGELPEAGTSKQTERGTPGALLTKQQWVMPSCQESARPAPVTQETTLTPSAPAAVRALEGGARTPPPPPAPPVCPGGLDLYLEPVRALRQTDGPEEWPSPGSLSQDGTLSLEGQLERRWLLWHEFMTDRSHLEDWLQRAEQLAASPNTSHVLHAVAKEELNKFEAVHAECRVRVAQLDSLTLQSCSLLRLFDGTMRARLVAMTKDCSQRWDRLTEAVECVCRRLRHGVSQRDSFDTQREEMAVWLADMDLRLTEVEHFSTNSTVTKMHQLQSFQEAVAENASRLSGLLESGEALIQRSEPADAQTIEGQLQELLLYCAHVFEGVGRLHTRLLSMRLVFEEDWALASHVDSGCPSETLPDDEEPCDWTNTSKPKAGPAHSPQDHLMLEWDPSVDIGGSVSHDDADSSYFSATAGGCQVEEFQGGDATGRRKPHLSSTNLRKVRLSRDEGTAPLPQAPAATPLGLSESSRFSGSLPQRHALCHTSTPSGCSPEPVTFDPERISAWLGQTGRHVTMVPEKRPCSKSVQTERTLECSSSTEQWALTAACLQRHDGPPHQDQTCAPANTHPTRSHDSQSRSDWTGRSCHSQSQCLEEGPICHDPQEEEEEEEEEEEKPLFKPCATCWSEDSPARLQSRRSWLPWRLREMPGLLALLALLGLLLALLLMLTAAAWYPEMACHRANGLGRSFHLALRYVNGPPPT
ncbi:uncharacterized protein si:ch211-137a8.2 isoform X2 [Clupea harengus]|uniref:Uncharacterized protein si:ch211-137a8.2 isoform X2 n=1 Tax=Clupea harengus TaxID=7950 RepID=A0A6P8G1Z6_CLUHA|nr:uncharacterized protein si:ch211-137a8.2 isoform X2 [Clupea harengus]